MTANSERTGFSPRVGETLTIDEVTYRFAPRADAPHEVDARQGRRSMLYRLVSAAGEEHALKVFAPRHRTPGLVRFDDRFAALAALPGLSACRRRTLSALRHREALRRHPALSYAVLMPWIEGADWAAIVGEKRALPPEQCLELARALATVLVGLEERGLAHCDLSEEHVRLRASDGVELVGNESMYAPGWEQPAIAPPDRPTYAHAGAGALWQADADRLAGAVLIAEMLGWCDERVRAAARGGCYFAPEETQQKGERYRLLRGVLRERWGRDLGRLFKRAWRSGHPADCPTFAEWWAALPVGPSDLPRVEAPAPEESREGAARAAVAALVSRARELETEGASPPEPAADAPAAGSHADAAGTDPGDEEPERPGPARKGLGALLLLAVLAVLAAALVRTLSDNPGVWEGVRSRLRLAQARGDEATLSGSGFIEARRVDVSSEVGGRIAAIHADEGDRVQAGAPLVRLDDALLQAQLKQAEAEQRAAEASLARVAAGARSEEIAEAQAQVARAEAAERAAYRAWQDAVALRDDPQELELQIDLARTQLEVARHRAAEAAAQTDAARLRMDASGRAVGILQEGVDYSKTLPTGQTLSGHISFRSGEINQASHEWNQATNEWWRTWINLDTAGLEVQEAEQRLADLLARRENPQDLRAQVDRAAAQYQAAQAATGAARARLARLEAGATAEQVRAARHRVEQAAARVEKVRTQLDKTTITAPLDGLVVDRVLHAGEFAAPHATVLTVGDLERVTLTIYIPQDRIGRVKVGQEVEVRVDSFPERTFRGRVTFISTEAEFTPKNIQTTEERVKMVFAVKAEIPNPAHELKPGMPADAVIQADRSVPGREGG